MTQFELPVSREQRAMAAQKRVDLNAKRLGITQRHVSEITRGKVELRSLDYLVGLCAKAGMPVGVRLAA